MSTSGQMGEQNVVWLYDRTNCFVIKWSEALTMLQCRGALETTKRGKPASQDRVVQFHLH